MKTNKHIKKLTVNCFCLFFLINFRDSLEKKKYCCDDASKKCFKETCLCPRLPHGSSFHKKGFQCPVSLDYYFVGCVNVEFERGKFFYGSISSCFEICSHSTHLLMKEILRNSIKTCQCYNWTRKEVPLTISSIHLFKVEGCINYRGELESCLGKKSIGRNRNLHDTRLCPLPISSITQSYVKKILVKKSIYTLDEDIFFFTQPKSINNNSDDFNGTMDRSKIKFKKGINLQNKILIYYFFFVFLIFFLIVSILAIKLLELNASEVSADWTSMGLSTGGHTGGQTPN